MNNIRYSLSLAHQLYGVDMNEDDWIELALIAWNFIGNKRCRLYRYTTNINCEDLSVDLPCNCDIVEAVTYSFEDWNYTSNLLPNGDINSGFTESYIESRKLFNDHLYINGKFAEYERVGDKLYFDKDYGKVNILYKGVIVDQEGLPEITDKEANAIAAYGAYVTKYKEGIITNNSGIIQIAQLLKNDWSKLCDAARVPNYVSQNEMDEILDVDFSSNRKIFNKSYKPIMK